MIDPENPIYRLAHLQGRSAALLDTLDMARRILGDFATTGGAEATAERFGRQKISFIEWLGTLQDEIATEGDLLAQELGVDLSVAD